MRFSRQALLGVGMIIGGLVMLSAMVQQLSNRDEQVLTPIIMNQSDTENSMSTPLTLDIDTEKRLLAQKQKERALRVAEQEKRTKAFSKQQSNAEAQALAKARLENQQYETKNQPENNGSMTKNSDRPKASQKKDKTPPKAAINYKIESGDNLLTLAGQYNVPLSALAQANKIDPSSTLQIGQALIIPSRKQVERLNREAEAAKKAADAKKQAEKKLIAARQEVKETDAKGSFGVQVALAINQEEADKLAKKFKAAGYDVKTSKTDRGVRVVIGPERGKIAALALKDLVNRDPEVDTENAWVLYW